MAYLALYRRWRPTSLSELKGQSHVKHTLIAAIREGKIGHAYLFAGPRGTGKTSTAKILAKALNCLNPKDGEPCGECESCKKIDAGASMDVFEIDAASNRGIDEIRDLRETVKFAPVDGKYKVYIIDEVHMLTMEAFNALLKTLEEPPQFVIFILATTEAHKVPATIQSRCQRYDFRRISIKEIEDRLRYVASEMKFNAEEEALSLIATYADGGLRDALSLLDQCAAMSDGNIKKENVLDILGLVGNAWTSALAEAIGNGDTVKVLSMIDEITKAGKELRQIVNELSMCLRTVMIFSAAGSTEGMNLYKISDESLKELSQLWNRERVIAALKKLNETSYALKWTNAERITVEVALLSLCYEENTAENNAATSVSDDRLQGRIDRLEMMVKELSGKLREFSNGTPSILPKQANAPQKIETTKKVETVKEPETKIEIKKQSEETNISSDDKVEISSFGASVSEEECQKTWENIINRLEQDGNKAVIACFKQSKCVEINESFVKVSFPNEMLSSIAEHMYKKIIEATIKAVMGKSLKFTVDSAKKSKKTKTVPTVSEVKTESKTTIPSPTESKKSSETTVSNFAPNFSELSQKESENLKSAIKIFGENFIAPLNSKKIKIAQSILKQEEKKEEEIPPPDEYDFVDAPDFYDVPPPEDADFY